jgi:uncharacterized protein (DUF433 family)
VAIQWQEHIEERVGVLGGKPVFKGTRMSVEFVLKQLGAGMTADAMLDQYPTLKDVHLRAALLYAAEIVSTDRSIDL